MDKDDKKIYNNMRKKFSRSNASEEQTLMRKEKDKIVKAESIANETEQQIKSRKKKIGSVKQIKCLRRKNSN